MQIFPIKTEKIEPSDNLVELVLKSAKLQNGDIIGIVSKVVSLTEGRLIQLQNFPQEKKTALKRFGAYAPNPALDALVRTEADTTFPGDMFLTIKNNIFTPAAGIDTSNVPENHAILWPKDSYRSAEKIRSALKSHVTSHTSRVNLGVLIFDSFLLPLRRGVTGIALGYSGFHGIENYKGKKDLFQKPLKVTSKNIADNLAATATLVCGEGDESIPFVILRNAPVKFTNTKIRRSEIQMPPDECFYKSLY
ncbi:MAG: coenzyme F420-0:L-glutamate ligase [Patescibacteria group bacterium]